MTNLKNIWTILGINLVVITGILLWIGSKQPKVVYIKVQKVYADFELKKQLENKFLSVVSTRKSILDSLEMNLKSLNLIVRSEKNARFAEGKRQELEVLTESYLLKKKTFAEDNDRLTKDYEQQVLTQLNQYIYDYGKKEGCDFIYGASGNGSIMYAADKFDITEEVIKYVNQRFEGLNK
jgi:outer membrane protein